MAKSLTKDQIKALSSELQTLLDKFNGGDLDSSTSMRYRVEGAVVALEVVLGDTSRKFWGNLRESKGAKQPSRFTE